MTDDESDDFTGDYESVFEAVDCTCEHDPHDHGWLGCDEKDCTCEASWAE